MGRHRVTIARIGGLLALVAAAFRFAFMARGQGNAPVLASCALALVAAGIVLWRPERFEALVAGDVLLALAILVVVFGWGVALIPALLTVIAATLATPPGVAPTERRILPDLEGGFVAGPARANRGARRAAGPGPGPSAVPPASDRRSA